jgi:hypothetical protein
MDSRALRSQERSLPRLTVAMLYLVLTLCPIHQSAGQSSGINTRLRVSTYHHSHRSTGRSSQRPSYVVMNHIRRLSSRLTIIISSHRHHYPTPPPPPPSTTTPPSPVADVREDCRSLVAARGCHQFEVLEACPESCIKWLSGIDRKTLNPSAKLHGPMLAPPGSALFDKLLALTTSSKVDQHSDCARRAR